MDKVHKNQNFSVISWKVLLLQRCDFRDIYLSITIANVLPLLLHLRSYLRRQSFADWHNCHAASDRHAYDRHGKEFRLRKARKRENTEEREKARIRVVCIRSMTVSSDDPVPWIASIMNYGQWWAEYGDVGGWTVVSEQQVTPSRKWPT